MMRIVRIVAFAFLVCAASSVRASSQTFTGPDTVVVQSGRLQLRALVWRPTGEGRFPAVLFNHGRGSTPHDAARPNGARALGPVFASHGYVFVALFRRGEGLSADQGTFIGDLLARERTSRGDESANNLQLHLMETDHLDDAVAGLAFLRKLPDVDARRVAVVGYSFGGSLTLLLAERDSTIRAAINFAGAAGSWQGSAHLRERLIGAVGRLTVPVLFVYAANDYSVAPGRVLDAEMARHGKTHRLKLFPAYGRTAAEGHNFVFAAIARWEPEVFEFLDERVGR